MAIATPSLASADAQTSASVLPKALVPSVLSTDLRHRLAVMGLSRSTALMPVLVKWWQLAAQPGAHTSVSDSPKLKVPSAEYLKILRIVAAAIGKVTKRPIPAWERQIPVATRQSEASVGFSRFCYDVVDLLLADQEETALETTLRAAFAECTELQGHYIRLRTEIDAQNASAASPASESLLMKPKLSLPRILPRHATQPLSTLSSPRHTLQLTPGSRRMNMIQLTVPLSPVRHRSQPARLHRPYRAIMLPKTLFS